MSAEGRIRTAFESAPYMVRYAGLWLPPDERGDGLTGWEDRSDAADDAELICFEDDYEPNAHEIMVSTPDELRSLLRAARSVWLPLVPSDGDEECYQALGYPTIEHLGAAGACLCRDR